MIKEALRILYKQKREELAAPIKLQLDDLLLIQFQQVLTRYFSAAEHTHHFSCSTYRKITYTNEGKIKSG